MDGMLVAERRLFRYLDKIAFKCLYAAFIVTIASYARSIQYVIPIGFKFMSKRINILF